MHNQNSSDNWIHLCFFLIQEIRGKSEGTQLQFKAVWNLFSYEKTKTKNKNVYMCTMWTYVWSFI